MSKPHIPVHVVGCTKFPVKQVTISVIFLVLSNSESFTHDIL